VDCRPREELSQILDTTVNITSDEIGVVLLELGWRHYVSCQYLVAKAGRKALYLIFNTLRHIES
jgi:hypothetical protein